MQLQSAFKGRIRTGAVLNLKHADPRHFLLDAYHLIKTRVKNQLKKQLALKLNLKLTLEFILPKNAEQDIEQHNGEGGDEGDDQGGEDIRQIHFNTKNFEILRTTQLSEIYDGIIQQFMTDVSIK